jgi:hypothetical protein
MISHPSILVSLNGLRRLPSSESTFVDKVGKLLLHELLDLLNGLLKTLLGGTRDVKVQRWVL